MALYKKYQLVRLDAREKGLRFVYVGVKVACSTKCTKEGSVEAMIP